MALNQIEKFMPPNVKSEMVRNIINNPQFVEAAKKGKLGEFAQYNNAESFFWTIVQQYIQFDSTADWAD